MANAEQARQLLSQHGVLRPQPTTDWTGTFSLPETVERFYWEVGPVDVEIEGHGNPFFLPSLAELWPFASCPR